MKYLFLTIITLLFTACTTNDIDYALARAAGNKPAQFFKFNTPSDANHYMFHHKDFDILMPETTKSDWIQMGGWNGAYIYGGIGVGLDIKEVRKYGGVLSYGINMTSSIWKYENREREIEAHNVRYMRKQTRWLKPDDILTIEHHGKENYPCVVIETAYSDRGVKKKSYDCYKFNPERTMAKRVLVSLIYSKSPKLPKKYQHLAKEYTYEDLFKRSKRVIDSLYIKDGWDE